MNCHVVGWMTYYHNVASGLISERRNVYQRGSRWAGTAFDDDDLFALAGWLVGFVGCFERGLLPVLY